MTLLIKCNFEIFEKISEGIQCNLCPHFCALKDGEIGKCRARHNRDGESKSIYLVSISSLAVEPIEKKPFKHFLPGTKTLTFGSFGCSLFCKFCENHLISQISPGKKDYFAGWPNLVPLAREKKCESISMSYNEPTLSYEFLVDFGERLKDEDLKFILKTNAYVNQNPWKTICEVTDAINIDWKGSEDKFKSITGVNSYVLQDRIKEAYDYGVHLEISIPLYYSDDELEDEIKIVGEFLSSIDNQIPCHLLRISPSYKYDTFIFNADNMKKAKNILSNYMKRIYLVN